MQAMAGNAPAQQSDDVQPTIDPRTRFPNNQPVQEQACPGLQRNMKPAPDCGETSYRGSGRLAGRHALITGGDSGIFDCHLISQRGFLRNNKHVLLGFFMTGAKINL